MTVEEAFKNHISRTPLSASGKVVRILEDDSDETPHQKFVVEIHPSHTVLVAHNLKRAYRVPVKIQDRVEIHGEYVWNKQGGIIHNTHHDDRVLCQKKENGHVICGPGHEDGWINFVGRKQADFSKTTDS